jgi:mycothiol system anti-sigma-R factor
MADCEDTLRELYTYLDNELLPGTRKAIDAHLHGCMDCLQAFDFHAELRMVIAKKCREQDVPPGLMERVRNCFGVDETL